MGDDRLLQGNVGVNFAESRESSFMLLALEPSVQPHRVIPYGCQASAASRSVTCQTPGFAEYYSQNFSGSLTV